MKVIKNRKTLTKEEFVIRAINVHGNKYDYSISNYINIRTHIDVICPTHGVFLITPYNHICMRGCPKCSERVKWNSSLILQKFIDIHGDKYRYLNLEKTKSTNLKIKILCSEHGVFEQRPSDHMRGHGCPKCYGNEKCTTEIFIKKANQVHQNTYDYSLVKYVNNNTNIDIICNKHGIFSQSPSNHFTSKGCPSCAQTTISAISQRWLDYLGIPNKMGSTREVPIKIGNRIFRVDGFNPETNTIYEFHGDFYHGNPKVYNLEDLHPIIKKTYGELLENTQKRSRLLKSNGYNVISIWESDWQKKEKEIKKNE